MEKVRLTSRITDYIECKSFSNTSVKLISQITTDLYSNQQVTTVLHLSSIIEGVFV